MSEALIGVVVGGLLGVVGTVVGTLVNYRFRQEERKSERRRELYESDLGVVTDSLYGVMEATTAWGKQPEERIWLIAEAYRTIFKSLLVAGSFDDPDLGERLGQLVGYFRDWVEFLDSDTAKAREGKEKEAAQLAAQTKSAASEVLRHIREILEEV